jgi:hypothetical protein
VNRKFVLILLVICVFLISGCDKIEGLIPGKKSSSGQSISQQANNLFSGRGSSTALSGFEREGINALEMVFLKDSPGDELFVNDDFEVSVYVKNIGASSIESGRLKLINVDKSNVQLLKDEETINLEGLSFNRPISEEATYNFQGRVLSEPITKKTTFNVNACFNYKTEIGEDVCITPKKELVLSAGKCQVKEIVLSGGQGAPIGVRKIEPKLVKKVAGRNIFDFIIQIEKFGKGSIGEVAEGCGGEKKIAVEEMSLGNKRLGEGIKCSLEGNEYRFEDDVVTEGKKRAIENLIRCRAVFGDSELEEGSFITPLNIVLSYGYQQSIDKEVIIKVQGTELDDFDFDSLN